MDNQKTLLRTTLFCLFTLFAFQASAHNLWIETSPTAQVGESHQLSIYLGEYSYGVRENIEEHRKEIGTITLHLITPDGSVVELETIVDDNRFVAKFIPQKKGTYQLALNATKAPVVDWREYDLGILKTNFFATASVQVGPQDQSQTSVKEISEINELQIKSKQVTSFERNTAIAFQVTFRGESLAEHKVRIGYKDQWFKTLYTDEQGQLSITFPWDGQFVIETIYTEETPGSFQGEKYEAVRHTATFVVPKQP